MLQKAKTYHKVVYKSYTSRPCDPDTKYQLEKSGHAQKAKFTFRFLSCPLFSLFLPHFFSLAGHLVGLVLVERVFRKAFRILGLGERKGRWVMDKIFREIFRSRSRGFLLLSPVFLTELCSFWYGLKDLFTLHKLAKKVVLDR